MATITDEVAEPYSLQGTAATQPQLRDLRGDALFRESPPGRSGEARAPLELKPVSGEGLDYRALRERGTSAPTVSSGKLLARPQ